MRDSGSTGTIDHIVSALGDLDVRVFAAERSATELLTYCQGSHADLLALRVAFSSGLREHRRIVDGLVEHQETVHGRYPDILSDHFIYFKLIQEFHAGIGGFAAGVNAALNAFDRYAMYTETCATAANDVLRWLFGLRRQISSMQAKVSSLSNAGIQAAMQVVENVTQWADAALSRTPESKFQGEIDVLTGDGTYPKIDRLSACTSGIARVKEELRKVHRVCATFSDAIEQI